MTLKTSKSVAEPAKSAAGCRSDLRLDLTEALKELTFRRAGGNRAVLQNGLTHEEAAEVLDCRWHSEDPCVARQGKVETTIVRLSRL